MRWPWSRRPERRASYTDAVVEALAGAAEGAAGRHAHATAALEACAALYAAAFARARVEGAPAAAISPAFLALVGRDLIRRGESVFAVEVEGRMVELRPAGSWDVRGGWREADWLYRLDPFGPSGNITRFVPGAAVLHFRHSVDPARPWAGMGPMQWAASTGALAGRIEAGLADEAGAPAAQLLPVPQGPTDPDADDDPLAKLRGDIGKAKGKAVLVETTAGGWGEGATGAPRRDWSQSRIGADWPDVLRSTRSDVFMDVAAACNVPGVLLSERVEGTSQREALRRFAHLGLEPLGELVAAELAAKLDAPGLRLDFAPLMASDLAGKARAIKGLVEAGVELPAAVAIAGLEA